MATDPFSYRTSAGLSPDGNFWWDGVAWIDANSAAPAMATRSPDGRYWWDGQRWRPASWAAHSTNGLAIASLVLGILWVYWIGSILAVIFGHIALRQTSSRRQGGRGLAIAGLVLGYIGVAVLAVVLAAVIGRPGGLSHSTTTLP